ncbi:MAG: ComF family protein, partial [Alphaproteobacteria bacterium]
MGILLPGVSLCLACERQRPDYDRARAVFIYDEHSRSLLLSFKHGDRTEAMPPFAAWMARVAAPLLTDCDVIAPVPLHRWRLARRRYNQSAMLAQGIGQLSGRPVAEDLLCRIRNTPSQGGRSPTGRRRNVAGAFRLNQRARAWSTID